MSTASTHGPTDPDEAAKEARADARRAQLLDAAARLMERDGSAGVSMQAVAAEAGVSVGLIYRYFGSKDDLLLAVIVEVLEAFADVVPSAIEQAGGDPVYRLVAAFRAYCEVIAEHRHATVLTYRESKSLSPEGRARIMALEVQTSEPLRDVLRDGRASGIFEVDDIELYSYDLLLLAHAWALKHWYFERSLGFEEYVARQQSAFLRSILATNLRPQYADLLELKAN